MNETFSIGGVLGRLQIFICQADCFVVASFKPSDPATPQRGSFIEPFDRIFVLALAVET